jgi:hypothetical protein
MIMANAMRNGTWILLVAVLVLSGCGRKEAPRIVSDGQPPQLVNLHHEVNGAVLKLDFRLAGSPEGVGYQIDRAEIDPYCKCPGFWRRYLEQLPSSKNVDVPITKLLKLRSTTVEHVFRIRAVDASGRLGPWSRHIRALGVDLFNQ